MLDLEYRAVLLVGSLLLLIFLIQRGERKKQDRRERLQEAFRALADVITEEGR